MDYSRVFLICGNIYYYKKNGCLEVKRKQVVYVRYSKKHKRWYITPGRDWRSRVYSSPSKEECVDVAIEAGYKPFVIHNLEQ